MMFAEIYLILIIIGASVMLATGFRVFYNYKKFNTKNDLFLILLLCIIAAPSILSVIETLIYSNFMHGISSVGYKISMIASLGGFIIVAYIIFKITKNTDVEFKFGRYVLVIFFILFVINSLYFILNLHEGEIYDINTMYIITVMGNPYLGLLLMTIYWIFFLPFIFKFYNMTKNISIKGRLRSLLIMCFIELKGTVNFLKMGYAAIWEIIFINCILDICASAIGFYIFYDHDFAESLFMHLNIESVYISNLKGKILYTTTFIAGKNKKVHDSLVGGLVKGTDKVIGEIINVRDVGLSRIMLKDGTTIMIEKSEVSNLYYIAFTRRYTRYTHNKVMELKTILDNMHENQTNKLLEMENIDQTIAKIFQY